MSSSVVAVEISGVNASFCQARRIGARRPSANRSAETTMLVSNTARTIFALFLAFSTCAARPIHSLFDVCIRQVQLRKFGTDGIGPLNTHRREDDLAVFGFHIEIPGRPDGVGNGF